MRKNSTLSLLALTSFTLFTFLFGARNAYSQNIYARQQVQDNSAIFTGGFFRNVLGQEDLILFQRNPIDSASKQQFTNKPIWLIGPSSEWIEVGALNGWTAADGGTTNVTFWKGSYYAKQIGNTYTRTLIGSSGATGALSYQLERTSQSGSIYNWTLKVTSAGGTTLVGPTNITHSKGAFNIMQVGIETGNTCNGFKNGTYSDSLYFKDASGFKRWSTRTVFNTDANNNLAQSASSRSSTYDSTNNRVVFSYQKNFSCT